MTSIVTTVRLKPETREILEEDAKRLGIGFSEYLRAMAEARELELKHAKIRAEGHQFMERLRTSPEAMAEYEVFSSRDPWEFLPPWEGPLPEAWRTNIHD